MKSYFVTLGFNESFLLRLLAETNAAQDDRLVIVVPRPMAEGTRNALENVKAQAVRLKYPTPEVREIGLDSFESALFEVVSALIPLKEPIITDLSMGMRMVDALILVSLLVTGKQFRVYLREETTGRPVSFSSQDLRALLNDYSGEDLKLLSALSSSPMRLEDLAKAVGRSEKTVMNRISELKRLGLIRVTGKDRQVELTGLGKVLLTARGILQVDKQGTGYEGLTKLKEKSI